MPDGVGVRNFVLGSFLPPSERAIRRRRAARHSDGAARQLLRRSSIGTASDGTSSRRTSKAAGGGDAPLFAGLRADALGQHQEHAVQCAAHHPGSWRTRSSCIGRRDSLAKWPPFRAPFARSSACTAVQSSGIGETARYRHLFGRCARRCCSARTSGRRSSLPVVLAARRAGVPTATFIFSWDNLSSKGRIAAPFDHYLVWSRAMRDELLAYYPDVSPERVHIVGTPQFDPYGDTSMLMSRADFFASIGADPDRPLICYSGGDTGNCPQDHHHVQDSSGADSIRSDRSASRRCCCGRHRPTTAMRYDEVRRDFPELIYGRRAGCTPSRGTGRTSFRFPRTSRCSPT